MRLWCLLEWIKVPNCKQLKPNLGDLLWKWVYHKDLELLGWELPSQEHISKAHGRTSQIRIFIVLSSNFLSMQSWGCGHWKLGSACGIASSDTQDHVFLIPLLKKIKNDNNNCLCQYTYIYLIMFQYCCSCLNISINILSVLEIW